MLKLPYVGGDEGARDGSRLWRSSPRDPSEAALNLGVRITGTLGDIDPLNRVLFKRARSKVKQGPL